MAPAPANAEQTFIKKVAALTGLDENVVRAWVTAEGAYAPNGTGHNNFLNIRESGSRSGVPVAGTSPKGFAYFRSADDAATETAYIIQHSGIYKGIRQATKLGPRSQLAAIAASPWDAGHYDHGTRLYKTYDSQNGGGGGVLGAVGGVASGFGKALVDAGTGNPLGAAGDVLGGLPGVSDLPGVKTAEGLAQAPATIAADMEKVLAFVFNPQDWLRVGFIIAGGVFVIGGLFILARSVGAPQAVAQTVMGPEALAFKEGQKAGRAAGARREGRKAGAASISSREKISTRPQPVYQGKARKSSSGDIPF